jgi:small ubiquitin-related modifier
MTSQEEKPDTEATVAPTQDDSGRISLRVVGQDAGEVFFKIRENTPLGKLFAAYCGKKGISPNSIRFLYDGQRLTETSTPKSMGMENDDVIDALIQQTGGK